MSPYFSKSGVTYPPQKLVMVGLKKERTLLVYASSGSDLRFIRSYPILGASGKLGPKLREGDMQVPEGIYGIESLNPNSAYHIATRVGYPNDFDREMARVDGRKDLGGNIMIHGGRGSAGCLAMGDEASEELFVLFSDTGIGNVQIILSPVDFRAAALTPGEYTETAWTESLYKNLAARLSELPSPG
jgi:murein L,D-transpeptidase YafK